MMKSKVAKLLVVSVVSLMLVGVGGGIGFAVASNMLNKEAIAKGYEDRVEEYMKNPKYLNGAMHRYMMHEKYPQLIEEADAYYEDALAKWERNQEELSPEEKQKVDKEYEEVLEYVKERIDAKFAEYGGY